MPLSGVKPVTLGSCSRGLLGPSSGHPGDRACLGTAAAWRGPLAALFTVAQTPGPGRVGPGLPESLGSDGWGWFQLLLMKATETSTKRT